jgi:PAS domain-containing protein
VIEVRQARSTSTLPGIGEISLAPSLVVGIVAGDLIGIEALKALFIALDDSAGMAFVVLQLGPRIAPTVSELLARYTDIPTTALRAGERPEPDHVYIAPVDGLVEIERGAFIVRRDNRRPEPHLAIDALFRSLASSFGARAACIVLAGSGDGGTHGLESIAAVGGMTIVQDQPGGEAARGRSRAAAQHVLSPFGMPEKLLAHCGVPSEAPPVIASIDSAHAAEQLRVERTVSRRLISVHKKLHARVQNLHGTLRRLQQHNDMLMGELAGVSARLSAAPLAVIALDPALRVCSFTPGAQRVYALSPADLGKPLALVPHHANEMPPLPELGSLQAGRIPAEDDVITRDRWYLRRTLPLLSPAGELSGVMVAFLDVTELKASEEKADPEQAELRSLLDSLPAVISYVDDAIERAERCAR